MARVVVAYVLWFFFGIFGVHHFYLKRDRHAFVWWSTLGGLFGLGWIRDLWRIPDYVKEANEDEDSYVSDNNNDRSHDANRQSKISLSSVRLGGMMLMGYIFGYLVMFACPQEWFTMSDRNVWWLRRHLITAFLLTVPPIAAAFGVHLVANIGRVQASLKCCLIGSFIGVIWLYYDQSNVGASTLFSTIVVNWFGLSSKPYRRPHKSKCRRLSILCVCGAVYLLLWGSALYFNATVTTSDGEEVPLREAISNFFKSPAWVETKQVIGTVWEHIKANGWRNILGQIIDALDPLGESNAYRVLGLRDSASQAEIKQSYRRLAKEWHPDKQKDPAKKEEAQTKFMEIQEAYNTLSKIRARRSQKNFKSTQAHNEPSQAHDEF